MIPYEAFAENLARVRAQIADACRLAGRRADEVRLLPVTKNHPADAVLYALRSGIGSVGENRVQEAAKKRAALGEGAPQPFWELIGHLQSNKAKTALATFGRIQSVDSESLAQRLDRLHAERAEAPYPIMLEVNAGDDPNKFGLSATQLSESLDTILKTCPRLKIDGLMTVAPLDGDPDSARRAFARLRELRDEARARFGLPLPELSMGMSGDLEAAICEGSTLVRIGTALFGKRDYSFNG